MNETTTIAALCTAPSPAGIAIIRVSGPRSKTALKTLFRSKRSPVDEPRKMIFGELIDYKSGQEIDHALAVYMPNPYSFTGEDVCEFQFHGSLLLVEKILRSLFAFGISAAEPGEFTKRAFINGKLDLVQAEAIAELINATSEQALKIAGEHLRGRFSDTVEKLGEPLRDALAEMEASIDFPDEDIEPKKVEQLQQGLRDASDDIQDLLQTYNYGHVVREGFRVLLCGRPNAGKSSMLNLLLGRPRAIVSEVSGTTRDLIEEQVMHSGFRFVFCDSAGITDSEDPVEKMGIELAKERIPWADLVLLVVDSTDKDGTWEKVAEYLKGHARKIWMVVNKIDLNPQAIGAIVCDSKVCSQNFYLSAKTQSGLDSLVKALVDEVSSNLSYQGDSSQIVTNERQRAGLAGADSSLEKVIQGITDKLPLEILSAELRIALTSLEEIVGKTYNEDILGRIFSKFCIGK